jgi:topoisomerase (DNA) II binding protein 1
MFANKIFYVSGEIADSHKLQQVLVENGGKICATPTFLSGLNHLVQKEGCLNESKPQESAEQAIFVVVDRFEGDSFHQLCEKNGAQIIGVRCIYESVRDRKPLPESKDQYPLYSRLLEGCKFGCSSMNSNKKENTIKVIKYMHGEVTEEINSETTALISTRVGSIKYRLALTAKIPILDPAWVFKCWSTQNLMPMDDYKLAPFTGCVISVTGLSLVTRQEVQRLISQNGGEYSPNLTKRCTHLIAKNASGLKFLYAMEWGIYCVSLEWFLESINYQGCVDETRYFLPIDDEAKQKLLTPSIKDINRLTPTLRRRYLAQFRRRVIIKRPDSSSSSISKAVLPLSQLLFQSRQLPSLSFNAATTIRNSFPSLPQPSFMPRLDDDEAMTDDDNDELDDLMKTLPDVNLSDASSAFTGSSSLPQFDGMDIRKLVEALASNPLNADVERMISACDEVIKYYSELSKKEDIAPLLEFINQQIELLRQQDEESSSTGNTEPNEITAETSNQGAALASDAGISDDESSKMVDIIDK